MKRIMILFCLILLSCNGQKRQELPKTELYKNLIGKWKVIESNITPFEHISYCDKLDLLSIFEFDKYGVLRVYENEKNKNNCNEYQTFKIEDSKINIWEHDFGFDYQILKLDSDSLILKTDRILSYQYESKELKDFNNKIIDSISEKGMIIKMIKI